MNSKSTFYLSLNRSQEHVMKSTTLFSLVVLTLFTSLIPAMHAQTFSVIHTFTGTGGEGIGPQAGVTIRGNALYGTTLVPAAPCIS